MRRNQQISELEQLLARERMILEQLRIHLEGLTPNTNASTLAAIHLDEARQIIGDLETRAYALRRQAGSKLN
jgi:hypothetical protein